MIGWVKRQILWARAVARWTRRNPPLRLAKLAARSKRVRAAALITQSLWLTPDLLSTMRPMRKWGYVLGCLGVATALWTDATLNLAPGVMAIGAKRTGEIGQLSGLWGPEHGGAVLFVMSQLVCGLLVVLAATFLRLDLGVARMASRALKIPPPRKVSFRYFLLLVSGDIATLFALFWLVLKAISPAGQATLAWIDRHPVIAAPLSAIVAVASIGGFMLWQLALRERGRQIYGEGRRPLAYSTVSVSISLSAFVGLGVLMRHGA